MARRYDVVVWGSTGFTGRLTCEYLSKNYPDLKWAIAGRNPQVLEDIKKSLQLDKVDILVGNINSQESLRAITAQTKVVLTTAGPYAKIGMPMVEACVEGGAHYCDLTGEAPFIRDAIDKFHDKAQEKNLKIVNCCGFDCIPCDLGVQMIIEEAESRGCTNGLQEIRFLADKMEGGASGGTLASAMNIFETLSFSQLLALLNPFYLNPIDKHTKVVKLPHNDKELYKQCCDNNVMGYDGITKQYTIPYLMQAIDLRLVNRSNALSNYRYGHTMIFSERMIVPNLFIAFFGSIALSIAQLFLIFPISRYFIKPFLPKPGEGPSEHLLNHGYFTAKLWGKGLNTSTGKEIVIEGRIQAYHGDPGYRQTAKMIAETAVCLAQDGEKLPQCYGLVTPSTALGSVLRRRLHTRGIEFSIA